MTPAPFRARTSSDRSPIAMRTPSFLPHRLASAALACSLGLPALAQTDPEQGGFTFPYPVTGTLAEPPEHASYALPTGPFANGALPSDAIEGMVDRRAWSLDAPEATLLDVLAPLRDQLTAQGFSVLLDCEARACGGFDFRFATEVLPEPDMHVDLGDYRFLSARKGDEAVGLFVSRSGTQAFVQAIRVGPLALAAPTVPGTAPPASPIPGAPLPETLAPGVEAAPAGPAPEDLEARLNAGLPVVLEDLVFASGSAALEAGDYPSLTALAAWLAADPVRKITLVGHSDASGGLEANIALSKRRAEAVRETLIRTLGATGAQIAAEGVGPLAPRDSNGTEDGRDQNRRVEAVPAPTT